MTCVISEIEGIPWYFPEGLSVINHGLDFLSSVKLMVFLLIEVC